ncbi:MAG: 16S rRNA (guanine(966)-N(2))-methyltransferase RsmD [Alphaproteobacteria bacterium]|nr:16S rRNA (guanine(966)-N(2))-methyltransferase RsmD [Alphaproteobacteria bacterium]
MRVTGGECRGRILKVPDTGTVRPTTDKMRQMLYNMLAHSQWATQAGFELVEAHVLDGFCGTGALGIEALSRGAQSCVFVDHDGRVLKIAEANVKMCGYDKVSTFLIKGCQTMGPRPDKIPPRNLVMLDPPYNKDFMLPSVTSLMDGGWLAPDALVIGETEKGWAGAVPEALRLVHVRADGDSQLNVWYLGA